MSKNMANVPFQPEAKARIWGGLTILLLGAWILHSFLALLIWAVVLAIATWPIYERLAKSTHSGGANPWVAVMLTVLIGASILGPLGYGLGRLLYEAQSIGQILSDAQNNGVPAPPWLGAVPVMGSWLADWWAEALATPDAARDTLHGLGTGAAVTYSRAFAQQLLHRVIGLLVTLLALFFLYLHGVSLGGKVLATARKLFGEVGVHYAEHAATAVRATVNGLVLVGLGEGLLLGVGYAFAGLSHPAMLGAITGVFAMIPFAAKLIFGACSLVLFAQGQLAAGTALLIFGVLVILIADNYIRPALIGGAVRLPFMWTLLGILGGLENFGLLGLFLGPTVMAVLISIWRDWAEDDGLTSP